MWRIFFFASLGGVGSFFVGWLIQWLHRLHFKFNSEFDWRDNLLAIFFNPSLNCIKPRLAYRKSLETNSHLGALRGGHIYFDSVGLSKGSLVGIKHLGT